MVEWRKESLTGQVAGCTPVLVWMLQQREKSLALPGIKPHPSSPQLTAYSPYRLSYPGAKKITAILKQIVEDYITPNSVREQISSTRAQKLFHSF
jgi:hypothetical protein